MSKLGDKRYSPTRVTRSIFTSEGTLKVIEEFDDATVRDNGEQGRLYVPQAMLRAYSNDPEFFGDEDYRDGNGIWVNDGKYSKDLKGWVTDCDNDIALTRLLGMVLKKYSWGHGRESWTILMSYDKDDDEWSGWGYDAFRIESWDVRIKDEDA